MGSQPRVTVVQVSKDSVQAAATLPLSAFSFYLKVGYGDYQTVAALLGCTKKQVAAMVRNDQLKVVTGPGRKPFVPLMQLAQYFDLEGMLDRAPLIEKLRQLHEELAQLLAVTKVRQLKRRGKLSRPFLAQLKTPTAAEAAEIMRKYD